MLKPQHTLKCWTIVVFNPFYIFYHKIFWNCFFLTPQFAIYPSHLQLQPHLQVSLILLKLCSFPNVHHDLGCIRCCFSLARLTPGERSASGGKQGSRYIILCISINNNDNDNQGWLQGWALRLRLALPHPTAAPHLHFMIPRQLSLWFKNSNEKLAPNLNFCPQKP